jgi:uridine kinase
MRDIFLLHAMKYPVMKAEDGMKLCYQSEFGGGHLPPSWEDFKENIREEPEKAIALSQESELLEPIGGGLLRLHLNAYWDAKDLRTETVAGLFLAVSDKKRGTLQGLMEKVTIMRELCLERKMPFALTELDSFLENYRKAGYPLCRHSEIYRQTYHPAYRLAGAETGKYLPLLLAIDNGLMKKKMFTVAIDGPSGAGKSSLAAWLQRVYGNCEIFHMDDFFLPPEKKTEDRLKTPGGNVDWERFLIEVLVPLSHGGNFAYRPYDCSTQKLKDPVMTSTRKLNIVEGVYSHHPELRNAYELTVYLSVSKQVQSDRILKRNGEEMRRRFLTEWIPLEDLYFEAMNIKKKADIILP